MNFLLYHESYHFLLTLLIALFLYRKYHYKRLILFVILTGIFIDIDHLFDYFHYVLKTSSLTFPFTTDYFHGSQKVFVLLHGWEWIPVLYITGKKYESRYKIKGSWLALVLGYIGHLVIDTLSYHPSILGYSLIYRIIMGFSITKFNSL